MIYSFWRDSHALCESFGSSGEQHENEQAGSED